MKTSEFKKILKENGLNLIETHNTWIDVDCDDMKVGYVSLLAEKDFKTNTSCPKVIAQAILDYAYTPLEEREEEKKYSLKMPLNAIVNKSFTDELILCRNNTLNEHFFLSNHNYSDRKHIQTSFTQKEIDEMPFDTKFFEKVEVK
jgi:hypothetical protein